MAASRSSEYSLKGPDTRWKLREKKKKSNTVSENEQVLQLVDLVSF